MTFDLVCEKEAFPELASYRTVVDTVTNATTMSAIFYSVLPSEEYFFVDLLPTINSI